MRLPIILMLAVIVFTPANIGEVARDAFGQARAIVIDYLGTDRTTEVAELPTDDATLLVASHDDPSKSTIGNIR
jgi:Sec-independent protein translocase protein TatA